MTARIAIVVASLLSAAAVAAGAFGAHALRSRVTADLLAVWQTAVLYHLVHALALFGVGLLLQARPELAGARIAAWLFVAGIALFCGSLYALTLTGTRGLGAVTPFGGAAMIAGWLVLAWAASSAA